MGFYRTILAVAVFMYHALSIDSGFNIINGRVAVFCFFVISGYYVELILCEKYTAARLGRGYLKSFYEARFWRLYPIYITVTIACLIISITTSRTRIPAVFFLTTTTGLYELSKGLLSWVSSGSMLLLNMPSVKDLVISPSWSIGVEVAYYAIAPILFGVRIKFIILLVLFSLTLQFIPYGQHAPIFFGLPFFVAGTLARRHQAAIIRNFKFTIYFPTWSLYLLIAAMLLFSLPHDIYIGRNNEHTLNTLDIFIYPLITAIIIPILHERTKYNKIDFYIGQLSFPFYIIHQPVIDIINSLHLTHGIYYSLSISLILSTFLMLLELKFIEPWRKTFSSPRPESY